jgi:hypothetical protein
MDPLDYPGVVMLVNLGNKAHRAYHPACHMRFHDAELEPDPGIPARVSRQETCGHCYACGGQLWNAQVGPCLLHDTEPCPSTNWKATRMMAAFADQWCVLGGGELDEDTMDVVGIVLTEPSGPETVHDLVDRVRYILDRTA